MASKDRVTVSHIDDPKYWRARADAAWHAAEKMIDPQARRTLIGISRSYEELARRTQARLAAAAKSRKPARSDDR